MKIRHKFSNFSLFLKPLGQAVTTMTPLLFLSYIQGRNQVCSQLWARLEYNFPFPDFCPMKITIWYTPNKFKCLQKVTSKNKQNKTKQNKTFDKGHLLSFPYNNFSLPPSILNFPPPLLHFLFSSPFFSFPCLSFPFPHLFFLPSLFHLSPSFQNFPPNFLRVGDLPTSLVHS